MSATASSFLECPLYIARVQLVDAMASFWSAPWILLKFSWLRQWPLFGVLPGFCSRSACCGNGLFLECSLVFAQVQLVVAIASFWSAPCILLKFIRLMAHQVRYLKDCNQTMPFRVTLFMSSISCSNFFNFFSESKQDR